MRRSLPAVPVILVLLLAFSSVPALAQGTTGIRFDGWGVRFGLSADPDQVYGGVHFNLGEFAKDVRFRPTVEFGVGDDVCLLQALAEVHYVFSKVQVWKPYVGGGLGLAYADVDDDDNDFDDDSDTGSAVPHVSQKRSLAPTAAEEGNTLAQAWQHFPPDTGATHAAQLAAFIADMDAGTRPLTSGDDARRTLELARWVANGRSAAALRPDGPVATTAVGSSEPIAGRYAAIEIEGRVHRIYYEQAGRGQDLLFLHTAGADTRQFHRLMNDSELLRTLPMRDAIAGMAEAVKVALIKDAKFFEWIERSSSAPVESNLRTGSRLEPAQLLAPHRSATQMLTPSRSISTALVEPQVRPSGILAQPSTVRYGLGWSLLGCAAAWGAAVLGQVAKNASAASAGPGR